ncbi:MAG: type II toxin-antitoxin system HicB family antitoxin [Desulfarculales bacterium]|jgi:predicted RNase H-like HicB family nuclease|nr:type II toxin-antitoxin system HicB family antitoxin [Desulfarculales bacterium]
MGLKYIAAFMQEDDGIFSVFFPDVEGAITQGEDFSQAYDMAVDALREALLFRVSNNKPFPQISPLEQVREKVKYFHEQEGFTYDESRVLYQLIPAPSLDKKPVRINITVPHADLQEIDNKARDLGMARSAFLVSAAKAYQI